MYLLKINKWMMKYKFSLLQYYLKYLEKLVIGTATLIDI